MARARPYPADPAAVSVTASGARGPARVLRVCLLAAPTVHLPRAAVVCAPRRSRSRLPMPPLFPPRRGGGVIR
eukprot:9236132-Alexandrium_andersonii.AAC.1